MNAGATERNDICAQMNTRRLDPEKPSKGNFVRVYLRLSAVGVFALLTAGCAELAWHKPGAGPRLLEQDLDECRRNARIRAAREAWPHNLLAPRVVGVDRDGRPIVIQPPPYYTERFLLEQDLTRLCMQEKGYALVPAEQEPPR